MKTDNTNNKKAAELPDDTEISDGIDYDGEPSLEIVGGSPKYHYFLAAKAEDGSPQTVSRCASMGYEVCKDEKPLSDAQDRVLMRIPDAVFQRRRKAKRDRRLAAREATMTPKGIPSSALVRIGEAGDRPGSGEEWSGDD